MYFVYLIRSKEGFRYTGMTEDLHNRLREHNDKTKKPENFHFQAFVVAGAGLEPTTFGL